MLLTRTHLCISGKLLSTILSLPSKRLSGIGTGCPGSLVTIKSVTSGRCHGWYLLRFSHLLEKSRHKDQFFDILDLIMITLLTVVRYFLPQNWATPLVFAFLHQIACLHFGEWYSARIWSPYKERDDISSVDVTFEFFLGLNGTPSKVFISGCNAKETILRSQEGAQSTYKINLCHAAIFT